MTRTSLLVLDARDVHILMDHEPEIATRIRDIARNRLGPESVVDKGDLTVEEINSPDTSEPHV